MKKKKGMWVIAIIALVIIIGGFLYIKNLTTTTYGKLDINIALMLRINKYLNSNSIEGKSIKEIRQILNNNTIKLTAKPISFPNIKDISVDAPSKKIPVRIYAPERGSKFPIIVYLHGGFWIGGNLDIHDNVCRKLAKNTNAIVVSVDYSLAPENPFPAGLNDVYNVVQWIYNNAEQISGDAKRIAIAGDSACGNLAAAVSQMARDINGPYITCQVLIYPSTTIYELNSKSWSYLTDNLNISKADVEKYISLYVPDKEDRKEPYASPLLAKNFKDLPNTLMIIAEIDPLRDEGKTYAENLKEALYHKT